VLPGARTRVYPGERMKSTVSVTKAEAHRGGELSLRFSGEIDGVVMGLEVTTFVRDVVTQVPATLPSPLLATTRARSRGRTRHRAPATRSERAARSR
jgi:hypothetical protein